MGDLKETQRWIQETQKPKLQSGVSLTAGGGQVMQFYFRAQLIHRLTMISFPEVISYLALHRHCCPVPQVRKQVHKLLTTENLWQGYGVPDSMCSFHILYCLL